MSEPTVSEFWQTHCGDCGHDLHPMDVCSAIVGGDYNGPEFCPCTLDYEALAGEYKRLRAHTLDLDSPETVERLARAYHEIDCLPDFPDPRHTRCRLFAAATLAALREGGPG